MSNMSYCRFENTLRDLRDCYDALHDGEKPSSEGERRALNRLLETCSDMVADFWEEET